MAFSIRLQSGHCSDNWHKYICCTFLAGNAQFLSVYPCIAHPTSLSEREIWNLTNVCDHWGGTWHCYCNCWGCDHIPLLQAPYCSTRVLFLQDPTLQSKHELRVFPGTGKAMLKVCRLNINFLLKINRTKWSLQAYGHQGSYFADACIALRSGCDGWAAEFLQDAGSMWLLGGTGGSSPHSQRDPGFR